jgi:hypothetical protein
VSAATTIQALMAQYSMLDRNCVFNAQILDPQGTLEFYGIKNNDAIVFVPVNVENQWMRLTREVDAFSDTIHFAISKDSRADFLRLKDLHAIQLESRPRALRKFMANCIQANTRDVIRFATIIGEIPSELSCDPLPVCW